MQGAAGQHCLYYGQSISEQVPLYVGDTRLCRRVASKMNDIDAALAAVQADWVKPSNYGPSAKQRHRPPLAAAAQKVNVLSKAEYIGLRMNGRRGPTCLVAIDAVLNLSYGVW